MCGCVLCCVALQVLLETQRLFPPIIGGSRGCERTTEVNGKRVEKGWKVQ